MLIKNTKIICTLGPASSDKTILTKMVLSGMNAARLNFSHGNYRQFKQIIRNVRTVSKQLKIPIAIIQDLQGPKIRVGNMPDSGVVLLEKEKITLTTKEILGNHKEIPVQYQKLPKEVKKGDTILLCDGVIELKVNSVQRTSGNIKCTVITGGLVKKHKGINVPTTSISAPTLTKKDKEDLIFGLKQDVDYIALSFVKNAHDIKQLKEIIQVHKKSTKVIAKIERHEAINHLNEIIEITDAIMIARGDLGTEIRAEKVPVLQKKMIKAANKAGIPIITATEILQSMIFSPRATRAEVSDAANAIVDHTDCLMLSNETAVGKFPVKAVQTLSKTAIETEKFLANNDQILKNKIHHEHIPTVNSLCLRACQIAREIQATAIVVLTNKGYTAHQIVKHRPYTPIITLTPNSKTQKELTLSWGLNHIYIQKFTQDIPTKKIRKFLLKNQLVKTNDQIVICNSTNQESFIKTIII